MSYDKIRMKSLRNSSLRIAAILGDRLFQGIRFEGELMPLTPDRTHTMLEFGQPDFLLVESVNRSSDGFWNTSNSAVLAHQQIIADTVRKARTLKIPSVFWLTVGHEKFAEYQGTANLVDLVACADLESMELMLNLGIHSIYLPPCVQPAIFNPFRDQEERIVSDFNILFDIDDEFQGIGELRSLIEGLNSQGMTILEPINRQSKLSGSVSHPTEDELAFTTKTTEVRLAALRNAKAYASLSTSKNRRMDQQWMSFEAAACRLAIVHLGRLEQNDPRNDIVIQCSTEKEFLLEFYRYSQDKIYRERIAHLNWRQVNSRHTFSHRISKITKVLGLKNDWIEFPKASIVTPTYRIELLKKCIDNYEAFKYPNKELVIIFNGNLHPDIRKLGIDQKPDVTFSHVPGELFAGASLNMGKLIASGKYIFRVDDDDKYGENYIGDLIFSAKSVNADLFGKMPSPISFENHEIIYEKIQSHEMILVSPQLIANNKFWLGGNSLSASAEFYKIVSYNDYQYGAADTEIQMSIELFESDGKKIIIAVGDKFNLVANRKLDGDGHAWRVTSDEIISMRAAMTGSINYFI